MNIGVAEDKYLIGVSGGMDSMVLLDILAKQEGVELVVAHFNHGIRPDSVQDEKLVAKTAAKYGLKAEIGYGNLGKLASEDKARTARYKFLREMAKRHGCKFIVTAHHQDDLIETAFLNLLRGSGRRGVSSIASNKLIKRPLLKVPKTEILKYAKKHGLKWREDSTNSDDSYARNYLRHNVTPKLTASQRRKLISNIDKVANINIMAEDILATLSHNIKIDDVIDRYKFIELDPEMADELVVYWLREYSRREFDSKLVKRISLALKTAKAGKLIDINDRLKLVIKTDSANLSRKD